jgi:hypothetical protein
MAWGCALVLARLRPRKHRTFRPLSATTMATALGEAVAGTDLFV